MKRGLWIALLVPGILLAQNGKGVVTGRLRTSEGTPAVGVRVAVMVVPGTNESSSAAVLESISTTDMAGNYRIDNITPGRYFIAAGFVDAPTYFPGTTALSGATAVTITATTPVTGMDFSVQGASTPFKVSGRVTGLVTTGAQARPISLLPRPTGPGARGARVQLQPVQSTRVNPDGTLVFPEVRPGTYSVNLAGMILAEPVLVTVTDGDITAVELKAVDPDDVTRMQGLEKAWSLDGSWGGIALDEKTNVLHATSPGSRLEIDAAGKTLRTNPLPVTPILRVARRDPEGSLAFLSFSTWSAAVKAFDSSGTELWSYPENGSTGIDEAQAVDLDGDGVDEVIVGFNGGTGMHVLNAKGKLLWQSTGIGNVWHVSAGDVAGDGKPRVVTTSATGAIHVFSTDGKDRKNLDAGLYANMVRVGKISTQDGPATILVAGEIPGGPAKTLSVAAFSGDGVKKWSKQLEVSTPSVYSATLAPEKPWLALGLQGGLVYIVHAETGAVLASLNGQGLSPDVAWIKDTDKDLPLLVVSTRSKLNAYSVTEK